MLIAMDAPEHGPARKAVLGEFTVRRSEALRPRIQEIVDERIDALLAGPKPGDLVETLSLPVPSLVICEMLGVPYADHDFFQTHTAKLIKRDTPPEQRRAAVDAVREYMSDLIAGKEQNPPDDLLGRQIVKLREEGTYRRAALAATGFLLLVAGHETTANTLAWVFERLSRTPGGLERVASEPEYAEAAVRETLRLRPVIAVVARRLTRAASIGGRALPEGTVVVPCILLVHRRPDVYPDPDAFRPERFLDRPPGTYTWIPFGGGVRRCLGASFAQMELEVVLRRIAQRVALAPVGDPEPVRRRAITLVPARGGEMRVLARR
jgi:cytochrome P450